MRSLLEAQQLEIAQSVAKIENATRYRHLGKPIGGTLIALALVFLFIGESCRLKLRHETRGSDEARGNPQVLIAISRCKKHSWRTLQCFHHQGEASRSRVSVLAHSFSLHSPPFSPRGETLAHSCDPAPSLIPVGPLVTADELHLRPIQAKDIRLLIPCLLIIPPRGPVGSLVVFVVFSPVHLAFYTYASLLSRCACLTRSRGRSLVV